MPEEEENKEKEIDFTTLILMVFLALCFDGVQVGLAIIPVIGWGLAPLVGFVAFLTFYFWFRSHNIDFLTLKRAKWLGTGIIIELMPLIDLIPTWTFLVIKFALENRSKNKL